MLVAYLNDCGKYGSIIAAYVSPSQAIKVRKVSGDLVFNDDGSISQSPEWLFPWERENEESYARKQQKAFLNIKGWELYAN